MPPPRCAKWWSRLQFDDTLYMIDHSQVEQRYYALGRTHAGRLLFVVFTVRNNLLRVISAGDMNRKERAIYAEANP